MRPTSEATSQALRGLYGSREKAPDFDVPVSELLQDDTWEVSKNPQPGLIFGVWFVRNKKVTKCEQVLKAMPWAMGLPFHRIPANSNPPGLIETPLLSRSSRANLKVLSLVFSNDFDRTWSWLWWGCGSSNRLEAN